MSLSARSTLNTSRDRDSTVSLGSPVHCQAILSMKKFFLTPSQNLPLAISWHPITCHFRQETDPLLVSTSIQVLVERCRDLPLASPETPHEVQSKVQMWGEAEGQRVHSARPGSHLPHQLAAPLPSRTLGTGMSFSQHNLHGAVQVLLHSSALQIKPVLLVK